MFAVPGWSVDSSALKQQAPAPKATAPKSNGTPEVSEDGTRASGKKRKRNGKEVNKNNLGEMWAQVIEGKPKQKKVKKDSKLVEQMGKSVGDGGAENASVTDREKNKKSKKGNRGKHTGATPVALTEDETPKPVLPPTTKLTPLQAAMRQKLVSARFRHLNQTLYTTPSKESLELVTSDPEIFNEYHEGFRRQVEVWPENPVDGYIKDIVRRGAIRTSASRPTDSAADQPLPRTNNTCTVADLGCGDAALSLNLQPHLKKLSLRIHSFDLHAASSLITKADIASLPLQDNSVDVAIFCLALMGTNWIEFIEEAFRILRWKGELWISEIKSRFSRGGAGGSKVVDHSVGKRQKGTPSEAKAFQKSQRQKQEIADDALAAVEIDGQPSTREETDVSAFVEVLRKRGFILKGDGRPGGEKEGLDSRNKMFVKMWFVKSGKPTKGKHAVVMKDGGEGQGRQGQGEQTWKHKVQKGVEDDEGGRGNEGSVLKPCVYKLR